MRKISFTLLFILSIYGCQNPGTDQNDRSINPQSRSVSRSSPEWDNLFYRKTGWFGGDGIFCIPMDGREAIPATEDTESLWVFSDTLIGNIKGDSIENDGYVMIHNSIGFFKGRKPDKKNMEFYYPVDESGKPETLFHPQTPEAGEDNYLWLGDGFVNASVDSTLYIFAYRIRNTEGEFFNFEQLGVALIAIPRGSEPPFIDQKQYETPLFYPAENGKGDVTWGSGILVNTEEAGVPNPDGFIYVYGVQGMFKVLLAARVLPEDILNFEEYRFWNGKDWVEDKHEAKPILKGVSNEMSMSAVQDGRYVASYQSGIFAPDVAVQMATSPIGPFYPKKIIWSAPEVNEDLDYFAYNAKAHPHLAPSNKLLISYNLNSLDFFTDVLDDPNLYRPRFVEVDLD
ncbi:DUF4185 domain-containing protein [Bacteroidota bacterium]